MNTKRLTYDACKKMPIGTVVADAEGHWSRIGRHYVKTTSNTWAVFFHYPSDEEINEVVLEKRNNLSPCPDGMANVFYPQGQRIVIDLNSGDWLNSVSITPEQAARVAASVLPGVSPEEVDEWHSSVLQADTPSIGIPGFQEDIVKLSSLTILGGKN